MSYEAIAGMLEMGLFYGLALGVGIWQVVKMRRMLARDRAAEAERARTSASTDKPG